MSTTETGEPSESITYHEYRAFIVYPGGIARKKMTWMEWWKFITSTRTDHFIFVHETNVATEYLLIQVFRFRKANCYYRSIKQDEFEIWYRHNHLGGKAFELNDTVFEVFSRMTSNTYRKTILPWRRYSIPYTYVHSMLQRYLEASDRMPNPTRKRRRRGRTRHRFVAQNSG